MTVASEYDLMMFISQTYHEKKAELKIYPGGKVDTRKVFENVVICAYSLYATSLGFENTSQIKSAFSKWRKERKKGITPKNSPKKSVELSSKKEDFIDPLVEQINQLDLNPESYF